MSQLECQSKHFVCWGGFQDIAYWSTEGQTVGSTWLTITGTINSLLVVSSELVIYFY